MAGYEQISCPACEKVDIKKVGLTPQGKQRYYCNNTDCKKKTFLNNYQYNARKPGVTKQIIAMAINGSGIRDTSRVLGVSKTTVIKTLKKSVRFSHITSRLLFREVAKWKQFNGQFGALSVRS